MLDFLHMYSVSPALCVLLYKQALALQSCYGTARLLCAWFHYISTSCSQILYHVFAFCIALLFCFVFFFLFLFIMTMQWLMNTNNFNDITHTCQTTSFPQELYVLQWGFLFCVLVPHKIRRCSKGWAYMAGE